MNYMEMFDDNIFHFDSTKNILEEKDLGICADIASILTPEYSATALNCFQGCPYTNTGFKFNVIIDGAQVKTKKWTWLPNAMRRFGKSDNFELETVSAVIPQMRTVIEKITLKNTTDSDLIIPIQVEYRGKTRYEADWKFSIPTAEKGCLDDYFEDNGILFSKTEDCAFALTSSLPHMKMFKLAYLWEIEITIPANDSLTFYFSAHIGLFENVLKELKETKDNYENLIVSSFKWLEKESDRILSNLPRFDSDNKKLNDLYYRSLVTYIMCRWENPDLCQSPFFSTGSINGGCMCSYLWDYCGGLMIHPLYDAEGNKKQLKTYLRNDLTTSYAINPVTGNPVGPWYQVNQEKVIQMVYYHVLFTGDKNFLFEKAGDKTVLEWMTHHAYVCDDKSKDVGLYDYGEGGKDHLELRRGIPYNGIMPDLNARRYMNYMKVYELTKVAGQPDEELPKRASALKEKLKTLWNDEVKWYDFIRNGERDIRYTVQMFKFLNSDVIGKKEREGLISHLNETEFLSKFGLHSMSKLDIAYDQDDIDNGGGGICTHFTTQICAQLYDIGYDELATDIMERIYWWGERLPYLGDSCAANMMKNREDTPLQGDISSASIAQTIALFIFGIKADFDGNITVCPVKNRPAQNMRLEHVRMCGKIFDINICDEQFSVTIKDKTFKAKIGETVSF